MLIATGILRTRHKDSSVTTLRGGGGAEKEFQIDVASCPIIFGQDCRYIHILEEIGSKSLDMISLGRSCANYIYIHCFNFYHSLDNDESTVKTLSFSVDFYRKDHEIPYLPVYKPHLFPQKIAPKAGVRLIYGTQLRVTVYWKCRSDTNDI